MEPGERSELIWVDTPWGRYRVWSCDGIGRTIRCGAFWDEKLLLPFYDKWARPDAWAIDIGACYGQSTVYLAKKCQMVVSVEPIHYTRVYDAISANSVGDKVIVVPEAAYSRKCMMMFMPEAVQGQSLEEGDWSKVGNLGGLGLMAVKDTPAHELLLGAQFRGVALDEICLEAPDVCLIKVDAQGCDLRALVGLQFTIEKFRPAILFEFEKEMSAANGDDWEDYEKFFKSRHYVIEEQKAIGYGGNWVALP